MEPGKWIRKEIHMPLWYAQEWNYFNSSSTTTHVLYTFIYFRSSWRSSIQFSKLRKQKLHRIKRGQGDPYSVTPCVSPVAFILFMQSSLSASHHWNRIEFRIVVKHLNLTRPPFHSNTSWLAGLSRVLPSFRYPPIHPSVIARFGANKSFVCLPCSRCCCGWCADWPRCKHTITTSHTTRPNQLVIIRGSCRGFLGQQIRN